MYKRQEGRDHSPNNNSWIRPCTAPRRMNTSTCSIHCLSPAHTHTVRLHRSLCFICDTIAAIGLSIVEPTTLRLKVIRRRLQGPKCSLPKSHLCWSKLTIMSYFFRRTQEESLSIKCLSDLGYLNSFLRYSRSKSSCVTSPLHFARFSPIFFGGGRKGSEFWDLHCKAHPHR